MIKNFKFTLNFLEKNYNLYLLYLCFGLPFAILFKEFNIILFPNLDLHLIILYRLLLAIITLYLLFKLPNKKVNYWIIAFLCIHFLFLFNIYIENNSNFLHNLTDFLMNNTPLRNIEGSYEDFAINKKKIILINFLNIILPLILFAFKKFDINTENFNKKIFLYFKVFTFFFILLLTIKFIQLNNLELFFKNYNRKFANFFINSHGLLILISLYLVFLLKKSLDQFNLINLVSLLILTLLLMMMKLYLPIFVFILTIFFIIFLNKPLQKKYIVFLFLIFFLISAIMVYQNLNPKIGTIFTSISIRLNLIKFFIFEVENFNFLIGSNIFIPKSIYTTAHNLFIDIYFSTGLVGIVLFIYLLIKTLKQIYNHNFISIIFFHSFIFSLFSGFFFSNIILNISFAIILNELNEKAPASK